MYTSDLGFKSELASIPDKVTSSWVVQLIWYVNTVHPRYNEICWNTSFLAAGAYVVDFYEGREHEIKWHQNTDLSTASVIDLPSQWPAHPLNSFSLQRAS